MNAWQVLGSWFAVFFCAVLAAAVAVIWLRRGPGASSRRMLGAFLVAWLLLTGCLTAFLVTSTSVGGVVCNGTIVDSTHEVQTGDLGSKADPVSGQCTDQARTRYVVALLVYLGLTGAGAATIRRLDLPAGERSPARSRVG